LSRRIHKEPAWLLHHRPYLDSSSILDVLSCDHGRLSLVARGSRSPKSRLKGLLRPFLPLQLSWTIRSDLGTLTGAEVHGAPLALAGEALLAGYYANELLLLLLHRHDPQPQIFSIYAQTIERLASLTEPAPALREFEMELLRLLGYGVNLDHDSQSQAPLVAEAQYEYRVAQGPVRSDERAGPMTFSGAELLAVRDRDFSRPQTLRSARRLLRAAIAYHLDGRELKSRRVLMEMRRGRQREPENE
jgi:DNA repair protein RecO (recombination protein O)